MKKQKSVIFYIVCRTCEALIDADVAELADALGSGPSSPKECGFKSHRRYQFCPRMFCGYGITAVHQPSKLVMGVRLPLPAPNGGIPERPKGADCKSAVTDFDGSNPSSTTIFDLRTATIVAVFLSLRRFVTETHIDFSLEISGS